MIAPALKAVADDKRRRIVERLRWGEQSAGELARHFDVSWPAISQHLGVLKGCRLVKERREGRRRLYSLSEAGFRDTLGAWVRSFDALWDRDLNSLKNYVEGGEKDNDGGVQD